MSPEDRQDVYNEFMERRGVETPCHKCDGFGTYVYPTTATWHRAIGGMTPTNGICDRCWGSGDEHKHWADLKREMI